MQRIDGPYNVPTKPELSPPANDPGFFSGGDAVSGRKATRVTKDWLNWIQEELCNVIEEADIKLDRSDDTQLLQALKALFALPPDPGHEDIIIPSAKPLEPGDFEIFFRQSPPDRWAVANGALLITADAVAPALWASLQSSENAWRLKSQAEWTALSQASPWNGIGGVPFFVLDVNAKTVRLPDLRGMYPETAGFDGLTVGGVHGDAIRNFPGTFGFESAVNGATGNHPATGPFYVKNGYNRHIDAGTDPGNQEIGFDPSRVVPTANVNRPRAFGVLGCIYLGEAAS